MKNYPKSFCDIFPVTKCHFDRGRIIEMDSGQANVGFYTVSNAPSARNFIAGDRNANPGFYFFGKKNQFFFCIEHP